MSINTQTCMGCATAPTKSAGALLSIVHLNQLRFQRIPWPQASVSFATGKLWSASPSSSNCLNKKPLQIFILKSTSTPVGELGAPTTLDQRIPSVDASVSAPPPPATESSDLRANMQSRYEQAYSMSQLYAAERPPPIPLREHERRRRIKDIQEVVDVRFPATILLNCANCALYGVDGRVNERKDLGRSRLCSPASQADGIVAAWLSRTTCITRSSMIRVSIEIWEQITITSSHGE